MLILIIYLELWTKIKVIFYFIIRWVKTILKKRTISFKEFLIFQSITAPTQTALQPDELIDSIFFINKWLLICMMKTMMDVTLFFNF
jgi:hypothetical protein